MGVALSAQRGDSLAEVKHQWLLQYKESLIKYASASTLEKLEQGGTQLLALAYQASEAGHECSPSQSIRFQISKDGGETWSAARVVVWGLGPVWAPVLFYDAQHSKKLFLFYSESRKAYSPGGDIKYIASSDAGETWAPPTTVYTHESDGECPKLATNRPLVDAAGVWYLPFQAEPSSTYTPDVVNGVRPRQETKGVPKLAVPLSAAPQSDTPWAGALKSTDGGRSWEAFQHPNTSLMEPSIELGSKGQLLMLFRTEAGKMFMAQSLDKGESWSRPAPTPLPRADFKVATVTIDGQVLCVYGNSKAPMQLAVTIDDGRSWDTLAAIEAADGSKGTFTSPSMVQWSEDTVKICYTVWGEGLRLASVKLATVEG